jgi:hypothetical protein
MVVNYKYGDLFKKDTVDKQLSIVSDDGKINITNTELHQEKFELTESLCSEQELTFGSCEAAMIKFTVSNTFLPMKGRWMTVRMSLGGHTDVPFQFGRYKVDSDTPMVLDSSVSELVSLDAVTATVFSIDMPSLTSIMSACSILKYLKKLSRNCFIVTGS